MKSERVSSKIHGFDFYSQIQLRSNNCPEKMMIMIVVWKYDLSNKILNTLSALSFLVSASWNFARQAIFLEQTIIVTFSGQLSGRKFILQLLLCSRLSVLSKIGSQVSMLSPFWWLARNPSYWCHTWPWICILWLSLNTSAKKEVSYIELFGGWKLC